MTSHNHDLGDAARKLSDEAKERTAQGVRKASDAVNSSSVGRGIERGIERTGGAIESAVRATGDTIESAVRATGSSITGAERYLKRTDVAKMRRDLMAVCGRNPGTTLCIGLGAGLLIGSLLRPRLAPRY